MKTFIQSLFCLPLTAFVGIIFHQEPAVIWQAALTFWPVWWLLLHLDNRVVTPVVQES